MRYIIISGIKVKTIAINSYEKFSDLSAGAYIVKLHTPRGIATKKILVE
ncbi:MAG: T9SS type A sorting domain-containing protein [Bacteroidales bacterium]